MVFGAAAKVNFDCCHSGPLVRSRFDMNCMLMTVCCCRWHDVILFQRKKNTLIFAGLINWELGNLSYKKKIKKYFRIFLNLGDGSVDRVRKNHRIRTYR
jgi:hypothetical protein